MNTPQIDAPYQKAQPMPLCFPPNTRIFIQGGGHIPVCMLAADATPNHKVFVTGRGWVSFKDLSPLTVSMP